jgi:hypothetical protein
MVDVARNELKALLDNALTAMDSPHVDLGAFFDGANVKIGVTDLHMLLQSVEPAFQLELGDTTLTVRRQDGGMMATLDLKW